MKKFSKFLVCLIILSFVFITIINLSASDVDFYIDEIILECGETEKFTFTSEKSNDNLQLICGNKDIATIEKEANYYIIKGINQGITHIYSKTKNGKISSQQLKVTVEASNRESDINVYISPRGEKYHYKASCARKNAIKTTLEYVSSYYEPCKKCVN